MTEKISEGSNPRDTPPGDPLAAAIARIEALERALLDVLTMLPVVASNKRWNVAQHMAKRIRDTLAFRSASGEPAAGPSDPF